MKQTSASAMDCIVTTCPYCDKEVIEINGNLNDLTTGDIQDEGELDCPHCQKTFKYIIEE